MDLRPINGRDLRRTTMAKKKPQKEKSFRFGSEKLDEVAAVLEANPEATDTEICEAVNQWWSDYSAGCTDESDKIPLTVAEVTRIRQELGVPQTHRKPFQKRLFEP